MAAVKHWTLDTAPGEIARRYQSRWHRCYVVSKLQSDPLYAAVTAELRAAETPELPVLDIGCGLGLASVCLRLAGYRAPILGMDYDEPKIAAAQTALGDWFEDLRFATGDATQLQNFSGHVLLLDVLQFLPVDAQNLLLQQIAELLAPNGGRLIIRSAVREDCLRFYATWAGDLFSRVTFWMKGAPRAYPTAAGIRAQFPEERFTQKQTPLWGGTPFNNYFFVFTRKEREKAEQQP